MPIKFSDYAYCPPLFKPALIRIENSPILSKLARGVFWSLAGSFISRGLMLCATVLVARILGKTVYGELGMIQSTVGMFGIFAGFGLGLTATKHVAEFRQSDPERIGRIIGLSGLIALLTGGIMALGLAISAPWLAAHTINAPHLAGVLRVGALILLINALNGAQTGALSGFEAFKTIAVVNLFVGLASFPLMVGGAYLYGLQGAVWALVINLVINWLFNHTALRQEAKRCHVSVSMKGAVQELPILWKFALPATLSGIMVAPAHWVCRAILTNQPNGYDELGILAAALVFQRLITFVSGTFSAPLLSMISSAGVNISNKLGTINIISTWILGVIAAVPLLCFPEVAQLAFGSDFNTPSFRLTFSLIVFSTTIITFKTGLARVLAANSLLWWGFFSNTLWAIILISCTVVLVHWGAPGLAVSLAIAYILNTVILIPLYHSRHLIPKRTMVSVEAGAIWLVLTLLVLLNIAEIMVLYRVFFFLISLIVIYIAFNRMIVLGNRSATSQSIIEC